MSGNIDNYNSLITSLKRSAYPHLGQQKVIFLPEIHTAYPKTTPSSQSTVTVTTLMAARQLELDFNASWVLTQVVALCSKLLHDLSKPICALCPLLV